MKKLLLGICTIAALSSFAQQKKDIQITLIKPVDGVQIKNKEAFDVEYEIKNLGPVAVTTSDSMYVVAVVGTTALNPPLALFANRILNVGDTIHRTLRLTIQLPPNTNGNSQFCLAVAVQNGGSIDSATANNIDCVTGTVVNSARNIAAVAASIKVYPNPAKDAINFSIDGSAKSISIMDITGKQVEEVTVTGNETKVDLSNYNNGIYLYQIKAEDSSVIKSGKFNVSK